MCYYGPKKLICPQCKQSHVGYYGDLIMPFDPHLYCKKCLPRLPDALELMGWLFGDIKSKSQAQEVKRDKLKKE